MRTALKIYQLAKRLLKQPLAVPGSGSGSGDPPVGGSVTFFILGF
jgi:hypothetical protein